MHQHNHPEKWNHKSAFIVTTIFVIPFCNLVGQTRLHKHVCALRIQGTPRYWYGIFFFQMDVLETFLLKEISKKKKIVSKQSYGRKASFPINYL